MVRGEQEQPSSPEIRTLSLSISSMESLEGALMGMALARSFVARSLGPTPNDQNVYQTSMLLLARVTQSLNTAAEASHAQLEINEVEMDLVNTRLLLVGELGLAEKEGRSLFTELNTAWLQVSGTPRPTFVEHAIDQSKSEGN